ncbi:MAG: MFS transporter [Chloroflexi bacterium]|nr:MFS transporter [Chloroflexota bacterium]
MAATAVWLNRTFSSLKLRNYRLLWLGSASEHTGEWMERTAIGWTVLQLTDSPFMLGLNEALRFIALIVFPFVGGAVADRWNRKKLLIATLIGMALLSAIIVALMWSGVLVKANPIAVYYILMYSLLSGVMTAFNHPARGTLLASIVDKSSYANAVSLDSISVMASRLVGMPLAVGWTLIANNDVSGIIGMRFVGCMLAVMWLLWLRAPSTPPQARRESMTANVKEGLRYVAKDEAVLGVTLLAFIPSFFVTGYVSQLPVFAESVLDIGPAGLYLMNFTAGLGSLIGLLGLASLGDYKHKGVHLFVSIIGSGVSLALFAVSAWVPLSFAMLFVSGATISMFTALRSTVVLLIVPDHLRGRVIALRELATGTQPVGSLLLGSMSEAWGAPMGLGIMSGLCAVTSAGAMVRLKRVRDLE